MLSNSRTAAPRCCAEERQQQIIEVATDLFARQGYQGTTTRQIADAVQVNEAIIFRHFPKKEDLYWAVIANKCKESQLKVIISDHLASGLPPEKVFRNIAYDFLTIKGRDTSLGRLLMFSALEHHELSHRFFRTHMAENYEMIARYIAEQIEAGKFRKVDPLLAARGFWGMVIYHFMVQEWFGGKNYHDIDNENACQTLTDLWMNGMLPRETE